MTPPAIGIVGASLAGLHAATQLRRDGFDGEVVVIGDEPEMPYDRPPLSKEVLRGAWGPEQVTLATDNAQDVRWRLGAPAVALDVEARRVTLADGDELSFDGGIVIATGARPRRIGPAELHGVHVLRTLHEATELAGRLAAGPRHVLVVGAGFIGLEVAAVCRSLEIAVTVIESLGQPLERQLGTDVGRCVGALHRREGVELRTATSLVSLHGDQKGAVSSATLSDGSTLPCELVVVGIGVQPCVEWLQSSGLTIEGGIVCDETCLAAPGIAVAGDVACWPSRRREELRMVEHWDNAVRQGAHAATRLLAGDDGAGLAYDPVPWFWSDQYAHKLQLLGSTVGHDERLTLEDECDGGRMLVLYRRGARLSAAFGIGRARQMVQCRRLLNADASWDDAVRDLGGAVPA